jgi:hypothetical protein
MFLVALAAVLALAALDLHDFLNRPKADSRTPWGGGRRRTVE